MGDDLAAPGGKLTLHVRVQCPNWIEVNRVQVFVNGKPEPKGNFTRAHPRRQVPLGAIVVFDETIPLALASDAHLVVACAGEGKGLGPVMGPDHEKDMPWRSAIRSSSTSTATASSPTATCWGCRCRWSQASSRARGMGISIRHSMTNSSNPDDPTNNGGRPQSVPSNPVASSDPLAAESSYRPFPWSSQHA